MTKLIFHQLWSDFKKHWLGILITLVLCYFSTLFVFSFVFSLYLIDSELYLLPEAELMDHVVHSVQSNAILYFIILAGFLLSAILVSRKFPVRLLKPMYFLPGRYRIETQNPALLLLDQSFDLLSFPGRDVSFVLSNHIFIYRGFQIHTADIIICFYDPGLFHEGRSGKQTRPS